jgi:hypothetical protein
MGKPEYFDLNLILLVLSGGVGAALIIALDHYVFKKRLGRKRGPGRV